MTEDRYLEILEPILVEMFGAVDWPTGFTPRLLLAVKLHRAAVAQIQRERRIADPRTKNPDMLAIIERFVPAVDAPSELIPFHGHAAHP